MDKLSKRLLAVVLALLLVSGLGMMGVVPAASSLFSTTPMVAITANGTTYALKNDGTVWKLSGYQRLGVLSSNPGTPEQIPGLSQITAISAGSLHVIALKSDGTVWAWGDNAHGQLGCSSESVNSTDTPLLVSGISNVTAINCGHFHNIVRTNDGSAWVWGRNLKGELGDGTTNDNHVPHKVQGLNNVVGVSGGWDHSVALKSDGTVWAWGQNSWNELGYLGQDSYYPIQVQGLSGISGIVAESNQNIALKNDGTVWVWGENLLGEWGTGAITRAHSQPVQVPSLFGITAIATGDKHQLVIKNDKTVWGWGRNGYGQLGNNNTTDQYVPVQAQGLTNVIHIAGGYNRSIALTGDGSVWTWGQGGKELGRGNVSANSLVPAKVLGENGQGYFNVFDGISQWEVEVDLDKDTDKDGFTDVWEIANASLGADPYKSDIFVEVDWLDGFEPPWDALEKVVAVFARANAGHDENKGINLHIVRGNAIDTTGITDPHSLGADADSIIINKPVILGSHTEKEKEQIMTTCMRADMKRIAQRNFDHGEAKSNWRYCVFVDKTRFETFGATHVQTFVIEYGSIQKDEKIADKSKTVSLTFMHELGHTLGLWHGGDAPTTPNEDDKNNYKPNYLSIMNYLFAFSGLVGGNDPLDYLDYSGVALPPLDESAIYEASGIDPTRETEGTGLGTKLCRLPSGVETFTGAILKWGTKEEKDEFSISGMAIDFNRNGKIDTDPIQIDLNGDGKIDVLTGYNDWENIDFDATNGINGWLAYRDEVTGLLFAEEGQPFHELTIEEAGELGLLENDYENAIPAIFDTSPLEPENGIFGTNARWHGAWWLYLLCFLCFGFIGMRFCKRVRQKRR